MNHKLIKGNWSIARMKGFGGLSTLTMVFLMSLSGCRKTTSDNEGLSTVGEKGIASGQTAVAGDEFTIVVIPDTQYYMETNPDIPGATFNMFKAQIDWIKANQAAENIVYVAGVGDIVDNGDFKSGEYPDSSATSSSYQEWQKAKYYYNLETPFTGHPDGIPYGLAVGNHDQTGHGYPLSFSNTSIGFSTTHTTGFYNRYFGVAHFSGKSYWGGSYTTAESNNNDSHYDLFSAGGKDFIVIYLEYDQERDQYGTQLEDWAYTILGTYSNRKAIVVMHALGTPNGTPGTNAGTPSGFYTGAQLVYNRIKSRPNVFLMLGGHTGTGSNPYAEGYRQDTYAGKTIKSMTSNYQWQTNGGNGFFRLLKFSVANDLITVKTYSPYTNTFETDGDSQFSVPLFRQPTAVRKDDFNQDGKSRLALFNMGTWKFDGMSNVTYGTMAGDWPIPSDYNGDGKAEYAVYRTSNYTFNVPSLGSQIPYGTSGDIPVPADYNGDGRSGIALYRPSDGTWHIPELSSNSITYGGLAGDIPIPADYDGDGKVDLAVYRPGTSGSWNLRNVYCCQIFLGGTNSIPVPGDYDGDGISDLCAFNKSTGLWEIKEITSDLPDINAIVTPAAGDIPVPDDYFGVGKTQPAIYRPSNHTLYMYNNGTVTTKVMGSTGDKPVNLPYHIRKFFFP